MSGRSSPLPDSPASFIRSISFALSPAHWSSGSKCSWVSTSASELISSSRSVCVATNDSFLDTSRGRVYHSAVARYSSPASHLLRATAGHLIELGPLSRRKAELGRERALERERERARRQAGEGGERPEGQGRDPEHEAAHGGTEQEAEVPRVRRDGHVAPAEVGRGEVGHERSLDRPLEALAEPEDDRRERERGHGGRRVEPGAARQDDEPRARPERGHGGQRLHAPASLQGFG